MRKDQGGKGGVIVNISSMAGRSYQLGFIRPITKVARILIPKLEIYNGIIKVITFVKTFSTQMFICVTI